jgi:hypothetical protein
MLWSRACAAGAAVERVALARVAVARSGLRSRGVECAGGVGDHDALVHVGDRLLRTDTGAHEVLVRAARSAGGRIEVKRVSDLSVHCMFEWRGRLE